MDKLTIMKRIFESKREGPALTTEEYAEALKHFTAIEIQMMYWPVFNHESCFSGRKEKIISVEEAYGDN